VRDTISLLRTQTALGKDRNSQDLSNLVSERHYLVIKNTDCFGKDGNSQELSKLVSERDHLVIKNTYCFGEGWKLLRPK
jgi:hypothetical protein